MFIQRQAGLKKAELVQFFLFRTHRNDRLDMAAANSLLQKWGPIGSRVKRIVPDERAKHR